MRAVIQSGWAGLAVSGDDVISVGDVPHDWLFGRAAAVVHHCGAGTTAAGLRAGLPTVAVPARYGDQPFWAKRLFELGVAPAPIPQPKLGAEILAASIREALSDKTLRERAVALAARINAEDGAGRVVALIDELTSARR